MKDYPITEQQAREMFEEHSAYDSAESIALQSEGDQLLWAAVIRLSQKQREVVTLHYYAALPLPETASVSRDSLTFQLIFPPLKKSDKLQIVAHTFRYLDSSFKRKQAASSLPSKEGAACSIQGPCAPTNDVPVSESNRCRSCVYCAKR
ncbi:hypothetical protein [Paenibacillus sp. IHBB 3054]|uniref:hypothetical protein n=1 Tax=Paenibacillus sp. IHBB 3054 TaxID=3425689 RepID=UPI003F66E4AC